MSFQPRCRIPSPSPKCCVMESKNVPETTATVPKGSLGACTTTTKLSPMMRPLLRRLIGLGPSHDESECQSVHVLVKLKAIADEIWVEKIVRTGSCQNPRPRRGPQVFPSTSAPKHLPARPPQVSHLLADTDTALGLQPLVMCLITRFRAHPFVSTCCAVPLLHTSTYHTTPL